MVKFSLPQHDPPCRNVVGAELRRTTIASLDLDEARLHLRGIAVAAIEGAMSPDPRVVMLALRVLGKSLRGLEAS